MRCPTLIPAPADVSDPVELEFVAGRGRSAECGWLVGFQIAGYRRSAGGVFHMIVGGQCRPLPLTTLPDRRWPRSTRAVDRALALVGAGSLTPGDPPDRRPPPVRPRVIVRTTVAGEKALVLAFDRYPAAGTVHGGHQAIVWNKNGAGLALSVHFRRSIRFEQRLAVLRQVAASTRPVDRS